MTTAVATVEAALERGAAIRPAVGGFPYLAAALRAAGVSRVHVAVPSNAFSYETDEGTVLIQQAPLAAGVVDVAPFDGDAVAAAIRADLAGRTTFPQFMAAIWAAGVLSYDVDLEASEIAYRGAGGASHVEEFAVVAI